MRKSRWMLATVGGAILVGAVALQGVAASAAPAAGADHGHHGSAAVLRFDTMTPVTGPYVGAANPIRGVAGGGLPWILRSGNGSLRQDGRLFVRVRGLVLAKQAPVPQALQGTNPFTAFRALVSCQTIGTGNTATVANVSTGDFKANSAGDSTIRTRIMLPKPCFAPIVFVTGPTGTDAWFAITGS
ncbi:MAG TPA: hypothetical protein VFQ44_05830 [Streptosporangiaceae bacterium]|nr:hypothetical protein [Streptosporangiaceae bacterium]